MSNHQTTTAKALKINLDKTIYGAFAEIGAGQEVARFFFQAGSASQTVAKTISAYDMTISDEIYGKEKSGRYVCEDRVKKMLEHEFDLLTTRLKGKRDKDTCFFAFANTVATASSKDKRQSHGWMGIRFQTEPNGKFNEVILHIRMLDKHRLLQQESLGILGVNLIHTCFYHIKNPKEFIPNLIESLRSDQIAIDYIKLTGPSLSHFDNLIMNLSLVRRGLADAIIFSPQMEILSLSDTVWNKNLLIHRGLFRPITNTHIDVLEKGVKQLTSELKSKDVPTVPLLEITMKNLLSADGHINEEDFLNRVEIICATGNYVLISNFNLFYQMKNFLRNYTSQKIAFIINAIQIEKIFDEKYYSDIEGGILEGVGRLFDKNTTLYVYPHKTKELCITAKTFNPGKKYTYIYKHCIEGGKINDIIDCDDAQNYVHSKEVNAMLIAKNSKWKDLVPKAARELIIKKKLFNE